MTNHKPVYDAIIIGAGIGGLVTAVRLASAGKKVIIFEKNPQVGGKMSEVTADGFRWDTGPSVITMRHVFEELFTYANRTLDDYIQLLPVDPLTRYFFNDGQQLDVSQNKAEMRQQLTTFAPQDSDGYFAYLDYAQNIHRITGPVFIYDQPPTWRSFLRVPIPDWFQIDGLRKMNRAINSFVQSAHLRQLLGRFATYVGASPYLAPATLNVIAHVELNGGVWYPKGGIYQIAKGLERLAQELGVQINTHCPVEEIIVQAGCAKGVRVAGEVVGGTAVVSNLDHTTTTHHLLKQTHKQPQEPSCSGFIMLLGVNKQHPQLAHHNIFFSADYPAEFQAIFSDGQPPTDPTIYVAITSKTDPTHAPEGCENWFILVNAPPLGDAYDWEQNTENYRNLVLQKLAEHGIDIRSHIVSQQIWTPQTLATHSGAWRGALYGASSNNPLAAFRRPHNRAKNLNGLYFVGGTTHPGGGVPMVTLSGKVVAEMILNTFA